MMMLETDETINAVSFEENLFGPHHHLDKRIKQRTGLPKKSHRRFLKHFVDRGLRVEDLREKPKLYNYIKSITREGYQLIIYDKYILVSKTDGIGVTLLILPKEYQQLAYILSQKKNERCLH